MLPAVFLYSVNIVKEIMTARDFCFWLNGYFELSKEKRLSENQIDLVKQHLSMVFVHEIDPSFGDKDEQDKLNNLHNNTLMRC